MRIKNVVVTFAIIFTVPFAYASSNSRYTSPQMAPDAISRDILSHPIKAFEEGAVSASDVPAAIERNYSKIIEQNVASMPPNSAAAWLDQLSDLELEHTAQLYVNSNATAGRTGKLLQVWASRLDGAHLAHVARYFGYDNVYSAIVEVAPLKAQSFAAKVSVAYPGPIAGMPLSVPQHMASVWGSGGAIMAGFTPQVSMTLEQLYSGFRSMQVGAMASQAAVYETGMYAGKNLIAAWGIGYGFGTGITYLMQEYTPDFYNDTFVPAVGGTISSAVNFVQNLVTTVYHDYTQMQTDPLGNYEKSTIPTFGVNSSAQNTMGITGGDFIMEYEYESVTTGAGGCHPNCYQAH
ncbi:MAG: hypothetical protein JSR59_17965 [Proteobacteria bacterium]|nr:hypothetical protein [Pseudomonadota bacterium]